MNSIGECILCGKEKRRHSHLICPACYDVYTANAGKALAQGEIVSLVEWAKKRSAERLGPLQEALRVKRAEYEKMQLEVSDEAYGEIKKSLDGRIVPREIFRAALQEKRKVIWAQKGGNNLHRELKILENQVTFLEGFLAGDKPDEPKLPPQEKLEPSSNPDPESESDSNSEPDS